MALIIIKNDSNTNNCDDENNVCDLINEFDESLNVMELTNVFQLRVEKAQNHLDRLKESIEAKIYNISDNNIEGNIVENKCLKDKLGKFSNVFITKSVFINPGQLVSVSDILQETCCVVTKLEVDRSNVQLQIIKQKFKVNDMLNKIEGLSFFRMKNMSKAVQKEHEACANDISELQWHIKHRSTIERKIREKRNKAGDMNSQLKEEIEEINEYIPLVQEKLVLETDMLTKIEETKKELVHESDISTERMQNTLGKHNDASKKAEAERQHRKRELNNANKSLTKTQKSLQHAIKEQKKLEDFNLRSEEKIRQNHEKITKLNSETAGKLMEQNIHEELVNGLESTMKETQFDNRRLTSNRDKKKTGLEEQEEEQNTVVNDLSDKRNDLDQEMTSLRRNNKQAEIEIDAIKESGEKCILDTDKAREKIESTKIDIEEAEKAYNDGIEEFTIEARKHAAVKQRLTEKMKEIQESEDKIRRLLNDIENQIKQEIMTKTTVKSKMTTDTLDLENSKKESIEKQRQMKKILKETQMLTKDMRLKVTEVESQHQKSSQELQSVTDMNAKMISEHESMLFEKTSRVNELTPPYNNLKSQIDVLTQKEEHVQWQIQTMNSQLFEMAASEKLIVTAKKKTQETLLGTELEYNNLTLELEMIRRYQDRLTTAISQIVSQTNRMRNTHNQYLQERHEGLIKAENELEQSLLRNATLAKQYRSSQTDYYGMQDSYLDVIQEHLWSEESVKDIKEIQRLQRHMHNCMDAFFTMKLMYDNDQFTDLQTETGRNIIEIERLKIKYKEHIDAMKTFLIETFPREYQLIKVE